MKGTKGLKIGDKVFVRSDLTIGRCGCDVVTLDMLKLKGTLQEVEEISNAPEGVKYSLKGQSYSWTPEMLKSYLQVGTVVTLRDDLLVGGSYGPVVMLSAMKPFLGKSGMIERVTGAGNYAVSDSLGTFTLSREMLVPYEEPELDFKVGDTVRAAYDCKDGNMLTPGFLYVITKIERSSYALGECLGKNYMISLEGKPSRVFEKRLEKYVPAPAPLPVPTTTIDYEALIGITIKDEDDELYESHTYVRHAEDAAESEKLFWSMLDRYAKDSFFNGMSIQLTLEVNGELKMDITAKSGE